MNNYHTRELSLAVYFIGKGLKYKGIERITKGSYFFVFEDPKKECIQLEKEFLAKKQELINDIEMAERNYE